MKVLALLAVLLSLSFQADASFGRQCRRSVEDVFSMVSQFMNPREFYRENYSPEELKHSDRPIVVTDGLREKLTFPLKRPVTAFLVLELRVFSETQFVSFMKREYGIDAELRGDFTIGFYDAKISGNTVQLRRFLSNQYARDNVYWVGLSDSALGFIDNLSQHFQFERGDNLSFRRGTYHDNDVRKQFGGSNHPYRGRRSSESW